MHTLVLDEDPDGVAGGVFELVVADVRERSRGETPRVLIPSRGGEEAGRLAVQPVGLLAGHLAAPAADASGGVDQAGDPRGALWLGRLGGLAHRGDFLASRGSS